MNRALLPCLLLLTCNLLAQDPAGGLRSWLLEYQSGAIRFQIDGKTNDAVIADLDRRMAATAAQDSLANARLLFECATADPSPAGANSPTELVEQQRAQQPWRVTAMAQRHLRGMKHKAIVPWLLGMLRSKNLHAAQANQDQVNARIALGVLAGHPSIEAKLELMRASGSMPDDLRVHAVNAMADDTSLELLPTLLGLLRDKEPNVRIAAANAIGSALQPLVDETLGNEPDAAITKQRDHAIKKLGQLLARDKVWQVRSAAAFALATMRCKAVIPVLIKGLDAELKRKKDPWAMDVRLHKLLEGLTGRNVARGGINPWKMFWKQEGPSFRVRPKTAPGEEAAKDSRYDKFFDLTIESDRVLFVLDFSGSMAEPVERKAKGTTAGGAAGAKTTKAELVVEELKKLVMALPDGALCNFVVFSEDVRIWRKEGDHPALVKLDDASRDELLGSFLDGLRPQGPTNLFEALDAALGFGGRGLYDKYYAAGFDTLYVITDGAPTAGPVTDKDEIRKRVRETNRLRKIAIHCITFGDQNDTAFLGPLARENGGRHIHVD